MPLPGCSSPPSLPLADFNYGADEYDAEGNEEPKALPEGSETMPYIDESPTMSPQLSARGQESGDGVSPTPTDGLGTGVGARVVELCTEAVEARAVGDCSCVSSVTSTLVLLWPGGLSPGIPNHAGHGPLGVGSSTLFCCCSWDAAVCSCPATPSDGRARTARAARRAASGRWQRSGPGSRLREAPAGGGRWAQPLRRAAGSI